MITRDDAIRIGAAWGRTELHFGNCSKHVGPRGGVTYKREVWRTNGACKTWKTRPNEFSLPIKYGFNGPYSYVTQSNAGDWHLADACTVS